MAFVGYTFWNGQCIRHHLVSLNSCILLLFLPAIVLWLFSVVEGGRGIQREIQAGRCASSGQHNEPKQVSG
ncbi:hypothetical protein BKA65DRAFT_509083 [Rhexocercosporidium sp. MPI-PUGE-AT-0058]|nr:hypothetical protein BKA65DRAFT_509083 [Rhexocercosporidium sp. MPI-PUGE-AT-0058]